MNRYVKLEPYAEYAGANASLTWYCKGTLMIWNSDVQEYIAEGVAHTCGYGYWQTATEAVQDAKGDLLKDLLEHYERRKAP